MTNSKIINSSNILKLNGVYFKKKIHFIVLGNCTNRLINEK